ncbi:hypothetical protein LEMLEM_LOCUS5427 [Lemmus lemmus]
MGAESSAVGAERRLSLKQVLPPLSHRPRLDSLSSSSSSSSSEREHYILFKFDCPASAKPDSIAGTDWMEAGTGWALAVKTLAGGMKAWPQRRRPSLAP